jgi:hypothetical protein
MRIVYKAQTIYSHPEINLGDLARKGIRKCHPVSDSGLGPQALRRKRGIRAPSST